MSTKPLPRRHEAAAVAFAGILRQAGCRAVTVAEAERGFRAWWAIPCDQQARTVKRIAKRVSEIMQDEQNES